MTLAYVKPGALPSDAALFGYLHAATHHSVFIGQVWVHDAPDAESAERRARIINEQIEALGNPARAQIEGATSKANTAPREPILRGWKEAGASWQQVATDLIAMLDLRNLAAQLPTGLSAKSLAKLDADIEEAKATLHELANPEPYYIVTEAAAYGAGGYPATGAWAILKAPAVPDDKPEMSVPGKAVLSGKAARVIVGDEITEAEAAPGVIGLVFGALATALIQFYERVDRTAARLGCTDEVARQIVTGNPEVAQ